MQFSKLLTLKADWKWIKARQGALCNVCVHNIPIFIPNDSYCSPVFKRLRLTGVRCASRWMEGAEGVVPDIYGIRRCVHLEFR